MDIIHDPAAMQTRALAERAAGRALAVVPTMGALHAGHLKLLQTARERVGPAGCVVATVFVNPIQFNNPADLAAYPRTLERDAALCAAEGVDLVFAPSTAAMYPPDFRTYVSVEQLPDVLCGAHRPGHFRGVTTVVLKLFMLTQPTCAVFGWKDAQQFLILRRMVADLALPIELLGVETVREPDGLALSSRNARLTPEERAVAPVLHQALQAARALFGNGERRAEALLAAVRGPIEAEPRLRLEYAELRDLATLRALDAAEPGNTLLALAAHLGTARLIDNLRL